MRFHAKGILRAAHDTANNLKAPIICSAGTQREARLTFSDGAGRRGQWRIATQDARAREEVKRVLTDIAGVVEAVEHFANSERTRVVPKILNGITARFTFRLRRTPTWTQERLPEKGAVIGKENTCVFHPLLL